MAKKWQRFLGYSRRMARRIAIVEDDAAIRANYAEALKRHGYDVAAYAGRREAMDALRARLPELAIIDIGLGEEPEGGFALCRDLRALSPQLPIVFLTARDSDFDVVSGLRVGADDYLTKGVSLPHLMARIGALFRRVDALAEAKPVEERIVRGDLELDLKRFSAAWKGGRVELTLTEFWIVHSLARHPGPRQEPRPADARRRAGGGRRHRDLARQARAREVRRRGSGLRRHRDRLRSRLPLEGLDVEGRL